MANMKVVEQEIARIEERSTKRQIEAAKLLTNAMAGDLRAKTMLQEGISSSDIPTVLEPAINVIFLAQYAAEPVVWNQIADTYEAPNFGVIRFGDFQVDPSALVDNVRARSSLRVVCRGLASTKSTRLFRLLPNSLTVTLTRSMVFVPACRGSLASHR
jgi:hypothetical protein